MNPYSQDARIRDVPIGLLRRYLSARGWASTTPPPLEPVRVDALVDSPAARAMQRRQGVARRAFDVFINPDAALSGVELIVPLDRSAPGADVQIASVVSSLAEIERSPVAAMADAINGIGYDIVRSRIPDIHVRDNSIRLERARSFLNGMREVLAAAATTEIDPQPYFQRVKKEAADFADGCRLAHTFQGSFGFVLESPLDAPAQQSFNGIEVAPFERRVMERFSRGLHVIALAASKDDPGIIVESAHRAFGANACEQFADMVQSTSYEELAIEVNFSPEWDRPSGLSRTEQYVVGPRHVDVTRAAAKELRDRPQAWDEVVVGRVVQLASHMDPSDLFDVVGEREVVVQWASENLGDVHVRASLSANDYLAAVDAHRTGKSVRIEGRLERKGRRWVLTDVAHFSIP